MAKKNVVTAAVRALRAAEVGYQEHHYKYVDGGGAGAGAEQLGLDPHRVLKTLILETNAGDSLCVLMHGDCEVSTKTLARIIGAKSVTMAEPARAQRHSGYQVGGTSPLGMITAMPIYCERSITEYESIIINGGKRGFLIEVATTELLTVLHPTLVDVAI